MSKIIKVVTPDNLSDTSFDKGVNTPNKIEIKLQYTIANLKSRTNLPNVVFITDNGKEGLFEYDSADTTSTGDDTLIIVTNSGKRYKKRTEQSLGLSDSSKYLRGDKTWQNISDLPVSSATTTALNLKENLSNKSTDVNLGTSDTLYPTQKAVKNYVDTLLSVITNNITFIWKLFTGFSVSELRLLTDAQINLVNKFSCSETNRFKDWYYDANDTTSTDNNGTILVTGTGKRLKAYNYISVTPESFGATGNGTTDDSTAIQSAIDYVFSLGGGVIKFRAKTYRCRNIELKKNCHIWGDGKNAGKLRFISSGDSATDSISYTLKMTQSFSTINFMDIDGYGSPNYSIGNGLLLVPDEFGLERTLNNVRVGLFAGYKSTISGGTYGVNKNFGRNDISDGAGGHLLTGGNAIVIEKNSNPAWNLIMDNVSVYTCDGIGIDVGKTSDSKFINIDVGSCMNKGITFDQGNKNLQWVNVKVYLCRSLNVQSTFAERLDYLIPHEITVSSEIDGAVVMTGANHSIKNFECQENGSHGIVFGTYNYSLNNCDIDVIVDGNGGYDKDADSTTKSNYQRFGILARNYYAINVKAVCEDFRSKFVLPRQLRGLHVISSTSRYKYYSSGNLTQENSYYIADVSGGADFTPLQLGYATTSNTVGKVFQARALYGMALPTANFGTGWLENVNDFSNFDLIVVNQYEQNQNTGSGYSITGDRGNSFVKVNGKIVSATINAYSVTSPSGRAFIFGADGNNSVILSIGGATKAQIYSSGNLYVGTSPSDSSDKFSVEGNIAIKTIGGKFKVAEGTNGSLGQTTLVSGTKAITISGVSTSSRAFIQLVSIGGTITSTFDYTAVCTTNTLTITAVTNTGTTNTLDTSTLNYIIYN